MIALNIYEPGLTTETWAENSETGQTKTMHIFGINYDKKRE